MPVTFLQKVSMKTKANLGCILIGVFGVTLLFANMVFAAERSKTANTNNQGPGRVTGQVSGTFGKQVVYEPGEGVTITPLSGGRSMTSETNSQGRYLFESVPPGQYEFRSRFEWTTTYVDCDDGTQMYEDHSRELIGRIQVEARRSSRILNYTVGPVRNGLWAYGGTFVRPRHPLVND
jgi:hypothetical protein